MMSRGQKHPGKYVAAEVELPSSRKHNRVIQIKENEENGHNIPIMFTTIMTK